MEKRLIAGLFLLLSFIMGIILAAAMQIGWAVAGFDPTGIFEKILIACTAIVVVFSILALLGAFAAITGKSYFMAILGGIFGLLCLGYAGMGSVFGLIGLILVLISKDEFEGEAPPPQPAPYGMPPPGYPPQQMPPPGYPPQQMPPPGYPPQQPMPPPAQPAPEPMAQPPAEPPAEAPAEAPKEPPEE